MPGGKILSKDEVARVLRRVGLPDDRIQALLDELPDPVDLDREAPIMDRHGIDGSRLTDRMGGSP